MCTVYDSCVHVLLPRATRYPPTVITTAAVPGSTSDPVVRDRHAGGGDYEVGGRGYIIHPNNLWGDEVSGVTSDYWPPAERCYWASPPPIAVCPPPLSLPAPTFPAPTFPLLSPPIPRLHIPTYFPPAPSRPLVNGGPNVGLLSPRKMF